MRVKKIALVLRKDGVFQYEGREIRAARSGSGYAVILFLEPSPVDKEFQAFVWIPSADELEQIQKALNKSDELTHDLLGHGWGGKRPFYKLYEFM